MLVFSQVEIDQGQPLGKDLLQWREGRRTQVQLFHGLELSVPGHEGFGGRGLQVLLVEQLGEVGQDLGVVGIQEGRLLGPGVFFQEGEDMPELQPGCSRQVQVVLQFNEIPLQLDEVQGFLISLALMYLKTSEARA